MGSDDVEPKVRNFTLVMTQILIHCILYEWIEHFQFEPKTFLYKVNHAFQTHSQFYLAKPRVNNPLSISRGDQVEPTKTVDILPSYRPLNLSQETPFEYSIYNQRLIAKDYGFTVENLFQLSEARALSLCDLKKGKFTFL